MEAIDVVLAGERRAKRAAALWWKQFSSSASTVGYGILAVGAVDPIVKQKALNAKGWGAIFVGAALLGVCLLIAPWTEVIMDGSSQGLLVLDGVGVLFLLYGGYLAWRTRRIDANIRRLEGLLAEEQAAARAHPAE